MTEYHDGEDAQALRRSLIFSLAAVLVLICGGWITVWALGGSRLVVPPPRPPATTGASRDHPSDELLETVNGLRVTQQQALDELQFVQLQLIAQQAQTKRLSEQIAAMTKKLDALQRSVADLPAPSGAAPASLPKE